MEGIAESEIAVEVSTAGLRKPVGEIYPDRDVPAMVPRGGLPGRAVQRRPRPRRISATATSEALELLSGLGVTELAVFERRERRLEPIG